MLLYILAGVGFWGLAKKKGQSPIAWAIFAVLVAVLSQFIGGFIVGFTNPQILNSYGTVLAIAIISSLIGLALLWLALNSYAKNAHAKEESRSSDLLDDQYLEDL